MSVYSEKLSSSEEEEPETKTSRDSDSDFESKEKRNKRKGPSLEAPRRSKRRAKKPSFTEQPVVSSAEQSEPVASSSVEQPELVDLSVEQPDPVASSSAEQPEAAASSDEEAAASSAQDPASDEDPVPLITTPCHDGNPDDQTVVVQSHDQGIPADKLEARHVVHQPERYCYTFVFILKQTCFHNDTFVSVLNHSYLRNDTFVFIIKQI